MSIYLVALNDPSDEAWDAIRDNWPKHHLMLTDRLAFVAPEESALTSMVAETIGINAEKGVLGIVVEMENKAGFNNASLKEWLGKFS